ncbi:MAG: SDR family NAD(P)-dependent oxidoreductase [Deltaproteobacteria bacterium]|nr:SDR family NAD(P)-dependent oxidoreductase [Deltaproteobacteria bacterium]
MPGSRRPLHPANPVVLVTGASTGIGLAIAKQLSERGDTRTIVSARDSSLPRLAAAGLREGERCRIHALDVTDPRQREAVVEAAERHWGGVDVLINNAGITYRSVTEHLQAAEATRQLETNFLAPMELARLVLPGMRRKRAGRIVNISSVSGMMAMPTMGVYSASKFALEGASESLWYEARCWNVWVTLVQPGFIHSSSFRNVILSEQARHAVADPGDPYAVVYRSMAPFIERLMRLSPATPEHVARRVLRVLCQERPPLRVSATFDARFFYLLRRLLPRRVYHAVLHRALPRVREWGG